MSRTVRFVLLGLGVVILAGFVIRLNLGAIAAAVGGAEPAKLGLAVLLLAANTAVKAVRWQVMTRRMRSRPLGLAASGAAILAGVAAASLTPGRAVEVAKPLLLRASHGVPMAASTAAVVVERLLDGAALGVLFAASVLLVPSARGSAFYPVIASVGFFLVVGAVILLLPHRLASAAACVAAHLPLPDSVRSNVVSVGGRFASALAAWREGRALGLVLVLSVAAAGLEVLRLAAVFAALRLHVSIPEAMLGFSAANLLAALTFIPGGIGITELSLAGIIVLTTARPSTAVGAAVLVDRALSYYLVVAAGGLILLVASRQASGR